MSFRHAGSGWNSEKAELEGSALLPERGSARFPPLSDGSTNLILIVWVSVSNSSTLERNVRFEALLQMPKSHMVSLSRQS